MTCPKCQGEMRSYERNGIHVDQCTECRGLFLDRGELEHLAQAEGSFYGRAEPAPQQTQSHDRDHDRDRDRSHGHDTFQYRGKEHRKRKKHFLEELLD